MLADGDAFAMACPGSGKTRTVGLRLAWASVDGSGRRLAATSYTNVAVEEMRRAAVEAGVSIGPEHFVGTLHSFLLRYIVYPFGHLEMGCEGRPNIVMDTVRSAIEIEEVRVVARTAGIPVWDFHFRPDGSLSVEVPPTITLEEDEVLRRGEEQAQAMKRDLFRRGFLSPSDAMYVAMRVLERQPSLAEALANRFDEIIVDEAQDTTDLQFACLDGLKGGALRSVVVVGDLDQAIYGWAGATPEACEAFATRHRLKQLPLSLNFRSSQVICDRTVAFSTREISDTASGPSAAFPVEPELFLYRPSAPTEAVAFFARRIEEAGLDVSRAGVLVRTTSFANRVNGSASTKATQAVQALGRAAAVYQANRTLDKTSLQSLEAALAEMAWGETALRSRTSEERAALRGQALALLELLPELTGDLGSWIAGARAAVTAVLEPLAATPTIVPSRRVRSLPGAAGINAATAFSTVETDPTKARTIHSAKGESHSATLLLGQGPAGGRDYPREWVSHLLGLASSEETRVAYVAITRPQRYLAVALPAGTAEDVITAFTAAGFILLDALVTGIETE